MKTKKVLLSAAILVVLVIVISWLGYTRIATARNSIPRTPNPSDPYIDMINKLNDDINYNNLEPTTLAIQKGKLQMYSRMGTEWASYLQTPIVTMDISKNRYTPVPVIVSKIPDGIQKPPRYSRPLQNYDKESHITSMWRKTTPGKYYVVLAGNVTTDPQQGMVLVYESVTGDLVRYFTPRKSGSVEITAESGTYLTLTAENGSVFFFDAAREQFIDSLNVPTITPLPTEVTLTPYP